MPNAITWQGAPTLRATVLGTELNALASAARTNASAAVANGTNLDTVGYFELAVTFGSAPSADGFIALYLLPALGGSTFADGSNTVSPGADSWVINIPLNAVTSAQNKQVGPVALPPCDFKIIAENKSGQAFPATGSTLKIYTANLEIQ